MPDVAPDELLSSGAAELVHPEARRTTASGIAVVAQNTKVGLMTDGETARCKTRCIHLWRPVDFRDDCVRASFLYARYPITTPYIIADSARGLFVTIWSSSARRLAATGQW